MDAAIRKDVFVLALKQQVIFPAIRTSITVSPDTFSELCDFCEKHNRTHVGVLTVDEKTSNSSNHFYRTGTWCRIASHQQNTTKLGDLETTVISLAMEGQFRFQVEEFTQTRPFHVATIRLLEDRDPAEGSQEVKNLVQKLQQSMQDFFATNAGKQEEGVSRALRNIFGNTKKARWPGSPSVMADMVAATLPQLSVEERQQVLDANLLKPRLELVMKLVEQVSEVQHLSKKISDQVQRRSSEELRETVLRRQLQDLYREMRKLRPDERGSRASDSESDEEVHGFADDEGEEDQVATLREALKKAQLSPDAEKIAQRELRRLQNIQPHHPEHSVCRSYLETLAGLPWAVSSQDDLDLNTAQSILEKDHYGLEKVKRRILEFLAVQKMRRDMKGPILCLHGPPGVGKTSLGRSVAKALNRKFHRIALGGVRDEAEIRGHRRTYIGSMPGAIMQALATLQVNNPVILLDEIDKLTRNAMFNPSGAMLELLDPEQNHTFKDHYINTPFDLSKVLFLCTCNQLDTIDRPLLDRMEIIELSGYTMEEKVHIAMTHLLPKQRRVHGLEKDPEAEAARLNQGTPAEAREPAPEPLPELEMTTVETFIPDGPPALEMTMDALRELITKWTVESGVRNLERRLAQVCRWAALRLTGGEGVKSRQGEGVPLKDGQLIVDVPHLPSILGAEVFEPDVSERLTVGVAMGLGVSATGGQLLFVEASRSKGCGKLTVTGQLGEVMLESVRTAMSLLRSRIYYAAWGNERPRAVDAPLTPMRLSGSDDILSQFARNEHKMQDPFGGDDIHVHFPAGAIPKDGPSAGVATTLALASLLLDRPVRSDTAVTGEITLRGHILPVGGIRDKVLAAHRAGIRHVLVPFGNQRHVLDEIPEAVLADVDVKFVKHIDQALSWAFSEPQEEHSFPPSDPKMPRAKL